MEAVVEANVDNYETRIDTNIVLQINGVYPLRTKICVGRVTYWDQKELVGTIHSEIFFNKDSLGFGYIPTVGDEVYSFIYINVI